jgi:hypothetical protein
MWMIDHDGADTAGQGGGIIEAQAPAL